MRRKRMLVLLLLAVLGMGADAPGSSGAIGAPGAPCPERVGVYRDGSRVRAICAEEAAGEGLTVIDLSDDWAPRIFARDDPYRATYVRLAGRPPVGADNGDLDRFLGPYGILPTPRIVARAMLDEERHACHRAIDREPLEVRDLQAHLRCDGLLSEGDVTGAPNAATRRALHAFQRRNFLLASGSLDRPTHDLMQTTSMERDYQALLRVLRERVVDATGLLADGSAGQTWGTVFGRYLDPPALREADRPPMRGAAPDRVAEATERAARALGWTDPEATAEMLRSMPDPALRTMRVAVELPPTLTRRTEAVELRLEIDRGDVWYEPPFGPDGTRRAHPVDRRPVLVVYATRGDREVPLVRWNTTIGGWRREVGEEGEVGLRYKASPVGPRVVRRLVVAPAWLPPESTPDDELMRQSADGGWEANRELMARGWGSAFGLVMLVHEKEDHGRLVDEGIRTHGTAEVRSVLGGHSHGCHRLLSHLATRLAGFVLDHRAHEARGLREVDYRRVLEHGGDTDRVVIGERGYLYELDPALRVDVLPGRIRGALEEPPADLVDPPSAR